MIKFSDWEVGEMKARNAYECNLFQCSAAPAALAVFVFLCVSAPAQAQRVNSNLGVAGAGINSQPSGTTLNSLGTLPSISLGSSLPDLAPTPVPQITTPVQAAVPVEAAPAVAE